MDMPKPSDGHKRLETMTGTWEGEEKMYPSQWDPKGGTYLGRTKSRLALAGFAVIGDYEQERDGAVTFSGHSVMTYDAKRDLYVMHWFDCMGSPPEVFEGRFERDVLTMAHGGPPMHVRMTHDHSASGVLKTKMEMSPDGNTWNTLFEGHYKRS